MKVILQRFGEIPKESEKEIVTIIKECYENLEPHGVELLDLLLFKTPSEMRMFYSHEREIIGVASEDFAEQFFAIHDAWRGTSRIAICVDKMKEIPRAIQVGALRHEVGHSVLHGSLEYYLFPLTTSLIEASKQFRLSKEYLFNLLYLISIAVKDFEVTKLLLERGYVEDQVAYSKHVLTTSESDLAAWKVAKYNPPSMVVSLAGRLKDVACFIALQSRLGEAQMIERLREELSYLPESILEKMLKIVKSFPEAMRGNTLQNVDFAIKLFIEDLLKPLLNGVESSSKKLR